MDTLQLQKKREKVANKEGEEGPKQVVKEGQPTKQQQSPTSSSPPSASSSPSHEFSFTISLHSSSTTPNKAKSPPSFAIDLSPADDIFFHGHLLPLHLLSHLPISPRSSTNSFDSFSVPIKDLLEDCEPNINSSNSASSNTTSTSTNTTHISNDGKKAKSKLKSFSLFGLAKWQKGCQLSQRGDEDEDGEDGEKKKKKRKIKFVMGHILKSYVRMVRPLLLFRSGRKESRQFLKKPQSFSGDLSWRGNFKQDRKGRRGRGQFSAPASMRTSPSNSGLLLPTESLSSHTTDGTIEELQSAIQAAIAHCKNSNAMKEEKLNC